MTIAAALVMWLVGGHILHSSPTADSGSASHAAIAQAAGSSVRLLDVPFIQQTEALCGGAAVAMVMRFWGATGISASSFAALVDPAAGGISGEDLLRDVRGRGWNAQSFRGDRSLVAARLADRQPVIALIEDRPGYFHFIVIVAWAKGRVIYHDPARAPFRVILEEQFDAAWQKSDRWTMLMLPPATGVVAAEETAVTGIAKRESPCDDIVAEGVRVALKGDRAAAREIFDAAAELCPDASGPLRESAGLFALDGNWTEAEHFAREAVTRDSSDAHAWRIVATSAYVRGDPATALAAWNRAGEPLIDLVGVTGLDRTRHEVASRIIGLDVGRMLTPAALVAAQHRLRDLPSAELASVSYRPIAGGRATVEAMVVERALMPASRGELAVVGIRLATNREVLLNVSSPSGNGELFRASWRWWAHRPRYELALLAPSRVGIWQMSAFGEKQTYGTGEDSTIEQRRGGHVALSSWTSTLTRWEVGAGLDTWNREDRTVSFAGTLEQRLFSDRLSLRAGASLFAGEFGARALDLGVDWRSRTRHEGFVVTTAGGWSSVTSEAPRGLWGGAGTGHGRDALLRAHPLLHDGRIDGEIFGRTLLHVSAELQRWSRPVFKVVRLAPATFLDIARADRRLLPGPAWQADTGVGLRVALPGSGVLRVDVGKGLRDGATALSFGWNLR